MRHGRTTFERYYHGGKATQKRNVFSITKSVLSALVGVALSDGHLRNLDQKLGQGRSLGSTGLHLRPRDLLKLGQLYLRRGRWRARQLVPATWVRESTAKQVAVPGGYAYGYLWWVNTGPHKGFLAQGYAGQVVAVFPKLDLVVVLTGAGEFDRLEALKLVLRAVSR